VDEDCKEEKGSLSECYWMLWRALWRLKFFVMKHLFKCVLHLFLKAQNRMVSSLLKFVHPEFFLPRVCFCFLLLTESKWNSFNHCFSLPGTCFCSCFSFECKLSSFMAKHSRVICFYFLIRTPMNEFHAQTCTCCRLLLI